MKKSNYFLFFLLFSYVAKAQLVSYSYFSPLKKTDKEAWIDVRPSPEQLAKSQSNLNDFRLFSVSKTDTIEVPFIMEWMGYKIIENDIPFEILPTNNNDKQATYINIKLKDKLFVNKINFVIEEKNYEKAIKVLGSNDNQNWQTIIDKTRIAAHYDELESYDYSTIFFNTGGFLYYRLIIDDSNSPAVTIKKIKMYKTEEFSGSYLPLNNFTTTTSQNKKNKTTEIVLEFPTTYYINQIEIIPAKKQTDFYRQINTYFLAGVVEQRAGNKVEYFALANSGILSSNRENFIDCYNDKTQKIKLEIFNKNNQPIQIDSIKVYYEEVRLIAKTPANQQIVLAYGKHKDVAPEYDLVHFKNNIPVDLTKITTLTEYKQAQMEEVVSPLLESKSWLWAIMIVIIAVVGFFSIKLMRKA